ncbi:MAG: hypothetical protein LLG01_04575 [Planctomycetaceae bacterium]|nr:hypothetical protein [Planctomycetaceae bacterium]
MKLNCAYSIKPRRATCNTARVMTAFGIGPDGGENVIARDLELDFAPGKIVLFQGPSGSGKSSLLRRAAACVGGAVNIDDSPNGEAALVDGLGCEADEAMRLLSLCGLGDAHLMLRSPDELSDGQRYRFALASCVAGGAGTIVADEWCAKLDRVTAKVVSRNARRLADQCGLALLLATAHDDLVDDLGPDVIVRCGSSGAVAEARRPARGPISFLGELTITEGAARDWRHFAAWHYRGGRLGPVRRVLLLRHGGEPVGICVFGYGPLASPARRMFFGLGGKITAAGAVRINREIAAVTRLVIDPRYRGAGIAWRFLRRACELTSWRWIELVSEMAGVVPFCQAAGFTRVDAGDAGASDRGGGPHRTCYGKSNWTEEGFRKYQQRVRFSRPAYFIFENKNERLKGSSRSSMH